MTRAIRGVVFALAGLLAAFGSAAQTEEPTASAKKFHVAVLTGGHPFVELRLPKTVPGLSGHQLQTFSAEGGRRDLRGHRRLALRRHRALQLQPANHAQTASELLEAARQGCGPGGPPPCDREIPAPRRIAGVQITRNPGSRTACRWPGAGRRACSSRSTWPTRTIPSCAVEGLRSARRDVLPLQRRPGRTRPVDDRRAHQRENDRLGEDLWERRVFFMQSGHGRTAYENPNYRTLVVGAIRWTAGKGP